MSDVLTTPTAPCMLFEYFCYDPLVIMAIMGIIICLGKPSKILFIIGIMILKVIRSS